MNTCKGRNFEVWFSSSCQWQCEVSSNLNILFQVRVTNVMDKALGKMTVTATSAEDTEGTTVLSNKVFTAGPEE